MQFIYSFIYPLPSITFSHIFQNQYQSMLPFREYKLHKNHFFNKYWVKFNHFYPVFSPLYDLAHFVLLTLLTAGINTSTKVVYSPFSNLISDNLLAGGISSPSSSNPRSTHPNNSCADTKASSSVSPQVAQSKSGNKTEIPFFHMKKLQDSNIYLFFSYLLSPSS